MGGVSRPTLSRHTKIGAGTGQSGTKWDKAGQSGTKWDKVGQSGTSGTKRDNVGQVG